MLVAADAEERISERTGQFTAEIRLAVLGILKRDSAPADA
jgi:hypothetical protein